MAARPPAGAKKKPVKVPPVPSHKRQQPVPGHSTSTAAVYHTATNTLQEVQFEPEGEYESIDAHLIQERVSDTQQNASTAFSQVQTSTGAATHGSIQEQLAGQFQHGPRPPLSYAMVKSKSHQRQNQLQIDEGGIKEVGRSLEPAPPIMPSPPIASGAGIQQQADNQEAAPPQYPGTAVNVQPLPIPIREFVFSRERRQPAKEYNYLVMIVYLSCIFCCCMFCWPWLWCCLVGVHIASKMTSRHNIDGDYVSAQFCSTCTLFCSIMTLLCCLILPATAILTLIIVLSPQ